MRRLTILIACLAAASPAAAIGISGNVINTNGQPVWPCNINVVNRQTGVLVPLTNDSTLTNGDYAFTLPNGRYDLTFKPKIGTHIFQGELLDQRVNNNTLIGNLVLPFGKYLSGKVVGTDALGVATTNIRFKTPAGLTPTNVQDDGTNPDGTFNALVDANVWSVDFIPANAVHKAPREILGVDLSVGDVVLGNVVVQDGVVFTCSVTDASLFPIANASVTARTVPGHNKMFTPINNTSGAGVVTIVLPAGTYDVTANQPPGTTSIYATATQYNVVPTVDATLPNFALPPARMISAHVVAAGTATAVFNADIDVDKMLPPTFPRFETPNDFTDFFGDFLVPVATGLYRVTINPPVATRLLPVRINNVAIGTTALNMGTISCPQGHWLDLTVVAQGTGVPVGGANLDLLNVVTQARPILNGAVTAANGFARIVVDQGLYVIKVAPPNANYDTAYVTCRTLADTAMTVVMPRKGVLAVGGPAASALRLASPWPNPARASVNFAFAGKGAGELSILDVTGRRVALPWQGEMSGEQTARWDGHDDAGRGVPNGIYFAHLVVNGERSTRRIVIAH